MNLSIVNLYLEILNFDGTISRIHTKGMKTLANKLVLRTNPNCLIRLPLSQKCLGLGDFSDNLGIQRLNVVRIKT